MNIQMLMEVTKKIAVCPCCGDETVGNGSKFVIEDAQFERSCRECGWEIKGRVENNEIIIEGDNAPYINAKKSDLLNAGTIRRAIISRNPEPAIKEKNTVYLQIKEGVTKEDLIVIARRMLADEIICQEEKYYVYGTNSMGSTWYLSDKAADSCTLWDGAPENLRAVYESKEEALQKVAELDDKFKFGSTRHSLQRVRVEEKVKAPEMEAEQLAPARKRGR